MQLYFLCVALMLAFVSQTASGDDCLCDFPERMGGRITVSLGAINNIVDNNYYFLVDYTARRAKIWHPRNTYFVIILFDEGGVYNFTKVGGCKQFQKNQAFNLPNCVPSGLVETTVSGDKKVYSSAPLTEEEMLDLFTVKYIVDDSTSCIPSEVGDHILVDFGDGNSLDRYYFMKPTRYSLDNVWELYPDFSTCETL